MVVHNENSHGGVGSNLTVMSNSSRSEVRELRLLLSDPSIQRDPKLYLEAVQKVIVSMTLGVDVSSLFSDMIKAGHSQKIIQKKLVYLYLDKYAESNSDLALMTINTLQKDIQDHNPMLRGLALRALCSLRLEDITKYLEDPLQVGLKDISPYVRKTAVMGVLKLFYMNPNAIDKMNLVDVLYQMLRDRDTRVVCNCIAALSEILANEGGMVVNKKIAHYLLNRLHEFSEWGQCQVLNLLMYYQPSSEDEVFDILTILDDRLNHPNCGVVMGAIRLFIHLTEDMPRLQEDVYSRIHTPILTFLCTDCIELVYTCLLHAQLMLAKNPCIWRQDYKSFYCRYTDPVHIRMKKVEILAEICMFESTKHILNELSVYATDVSALVARKAIQAVGKIALKLPARANACVDKLLSLFNFETDYITSEILIVMTNILRKFDNMLESILPKLPTSFIIVLEPEGKAALLWILGEYGESLPNTPYILEELINTISEESSSDVKLQLLSATMKMFFKRPPECQEMLGRLLDYTINEDTHQDLRDRAMLYYRLLKANIKTAKRVVCGQPKLLDDGSLSPMAKSYLLEEFNTLSVMFGKPSSEFISQKFPYILSDELDSSGAEASFEREMSRQDSISSILLNPEVIISAREFEKKWMGLTTVKEMHVHLEAVPPTGELVKVLSSHHIMTMASSPPDQNVIKYFFYAQHMSTNNFFFVEVNMAVDKAMLSFILKCENPKQATSFTKHFFQTLGLSGQPTPLLQWKTCSNIPTGIKNACGVFYNNQLHIGGGCTGNSKVDRMVYAYSPGVDMWKVLPPSPLKWFSMAAWNNELVLIGGKEESTKQPTMTNKLAVWKNNKWEFSLPPMSIARLSPLAISHGNYLAVAAGRRGYLGYSVEILDSSTMQWHHVPSLPICSFPHTTTTCGKYIYLMHQKSGKILYTDILTFVTQKNSKTESTATEDLSDSGDSYSNESLSSDMYDNGIWKPILKTPVPSLQIATVGGYVIVFSHGNTGDGSLAVHAYFPETNSWNQIGRFPGMISNISCISSPKREIYIVGGNTINSQYSNKIFQGTMKVSTLEP